MALEISAPVECSPSVPPGYYDTVPGYEETLAYGGLLPPPVPLAPLPALSNLPAQTDWSITTITKETAHQAFISYASGKSWYCMGPARDGIITSLEPFNVYRYRLETFAETRSTEWSDEPYTGQPEDAFIQPPPAPWTFIAQAPAFFQDRRQNIRVPYTSSVKTCHVCMGKGNILCPSCSGSGDTMCTSCYGSGQCRGIKICLMCSGCGRQNFQTICWTCGGSGYIHGTELCIPCSGSGRKICGRCYGKCFCVCSKCDGREKLLVFINLKIHWITYENEYVTEQSSGLDPENLSKVSGTTIFTDTQYMLPPLVGFPDPSINQESQRLIQEHQSKYFQTSRVLQQRHTIELIPVTKVNYTWHGESYTYIVFGNENSVYTDNYPAKCCCSVM
ncbi:protein SSUH2 homolog isoform X1 [Clarias gariepinus]|uniref:protein SSUH2 homolog isoform X1 n=1 Tax=Clarias gariepinus TaxID=13013 RepID=UPI00234E140B|nr:protein SSUH2 homolog isoform X1 [Clarias gariepinus]